MPSISQPETHQFADGGEIPNNPRLPLVIYKAAISARGEEAAEAFETLYAKHDWRAAWRYGVYSFAHYHSTAHEVLGVYRGEALIRLGHTVGISAHVEAGDVIVIPAGVGHQNLGSSSDFHVVGGYPIGQVADLLRGVPGERPAADNRIAAVPLPTADPLSGPNGFLFELWTSRSEVFQRSRKN
ncbi:MAG TPA: cupin domain-containing protein [Terrimicrobiaceae bacterium]